MHETTTTEPEGSIAAAMRQYQSHQAAEADRKQRTTDRIRIAQGERRPPGPPPCIYIILRIIGCRLHYRTVADGWSPELSAYVVHWYSAEREAAYSQAQAVRGLLIKLTRDEWTAAMDQWSRNEDAKANADSQRHG